MKKIVFHYKEAPILKPINIPTKEGNLLFRIRGWFSTRKWELYRDFYFSIDNSVCFIPKGFVFDGASVPRSLWLFLHPTGILMIPGLIHDFGYKYRYLLGIKGEVSEKQLTKYFCFKERKRWDILFREIAICVNGFKAINYTAYLGVRSGGWVAFRKHRKYNNDKRR